MNTLVPLELEKALTPAWMTQALSEAYPGVEVSAVTDVDIFRTAATKVRFKVTYADPSTTAPTQLFMKGFFGGDEAAPYRASGVAEAEVRFYREIAPGLSMELPPYVYGIADSSNGHGIIVMKDMIVAGAKFLGALEPYTLTQTRCTLDQLARLHASHWGAEKLARLPWLKSTIGLLSDKPVMTVERLNELMSGKRGDTLAPEIKDGARMFRGLQALRKRVAETQLCVVHGDTHAGNVYEYPSGQAFTDFQMVQRGCWALDIAYHIAAVLTVEERVRSEKDLLRHYLDRLAAHGATPPTWDEAWHLYSMSVLYGYYLWGITQFVQPDIIVEFVHRLGSAAADHDSFGMVGV